MRTRPIARVESFIGVVIMIAVSTFAAGPALAASWYVSPTGTTSTASGTGTQSAPWSLQTALNQPSAVQAGDTIWVTGGTYAGTFTSYLTGTTSAPIVVRAAAGQRATIDGGNSGGNPILVVGGAYTWYWGLEVMSSDTLRQSAQDGPWPTDIGRGEGVQIMQTGTSGTGTKYINMIVHDTRQGFSYWTQAADSEIHGSLIYYNGWKGATDRGHGHGAYVQNQNGTKLLSDNVVFRNFSHGFHAYGSDTAFLNNIQYVGNTSFSNGDIGGAYARNFLTGGGSVAQSPVWDANMTWAPWGNEINALGYEAGCTNAKVTNNYLVGSCKSLSVVACTGTTMTGNQFIAQYLPDGFTSADYPSNSYVTSQPTSGVQVFVRKNKYEAGRGNITVYAWDGRSSASVDVSSVLAVGATYEVRNAQNFYGSAVATGTYAGGSITVPLTGLAPAAPVGMSAPAATGAQFNAFVLLTTSGGGGGTAPTAHFTNAPSWTAVGQTVTFTDGSTGSPTSWAWTFGDGGTSTAQSPMHVYSVAGTYSVKLTVTNASGSSNVTQSETIAPPAPTASNSGPICSGSTLALSTPSVGGASYSWTGPNGFASLAQNPSIAGATSAAAGSYGVTVTVNGCTSAAGTTNVAVNADAGAPAVTPPAAIAIAQTTCCGAFGGATPSGSAALSAFVGGGSAVDDCDPSPTRLAAQVGGADVTGSTCFAAGSTSVTFRYRDSSGKVATAASTVTIRMFGDLNADGAVDPSDMVILRGYYNFVVSPGVPPFTAPLLTADLDHDGVVDPSDSVFLRGYLNFAVSCLAP